MSSRPNILYLTHRVPYPPNRGDRIRSYHILRFLAERANVYLGCLADEPTPDETLVELKRLCEAVEIVPVGRERWLRGAWSLATGGSATAGMFQSPALTQIVRRWAKQIPFDSVLAFCSSMFQYSQVPELRDCRLVVDLVDVDSQKWFDYAHDAPLLKRLVYRREGRQVRRLESRIAETATAVTLVSPQEAGLFRRVAGGGDRVHSVTNGVDLEYFRPDAVDVPINPHECVFVGVLDYRANVEGLRWFCREVWPVVRQAVPDAQFTIVGRRPVDAVLQMGQQPGVNVVGEVLDVREYVARAAVVVAPLQVARGIQNKVLEALAMAKPVVATPQALEGIAVEPGVHALEAAKAADWADAILHTFTASVDMSAMCRAARQYVEAVHCWDSCLAPLNDQLLVHGLDHEADPCRSGSVVRK